MTIVKFKRLRYSVDDTQHVWLGVFVGPEVGRLQMAGEIAVKPQEWDELQSVLVGPGRVGQQVKFFAEGD